MVNDRQVKKVVSEGYMEGNEELLEREMESDLDKRSKSRVDLIMSSRETVTLNSPFRITYTRACQHS